MTHVEVPTHPKSAGTVGYNRADAAQIRGLAIGVAVKLAILEPAQAVGAADPHAPGRIGSKTIHRCAMLQPVRVSVTAKLLLVPAEHPV
jgi:hypothetical protein